jgi:tetratricopeptide (TPR) repeat protein
MKDTPSTAVCIRTTGEGYYNQGLYPDAIPHFKRAVEIVFNNPAATTPLEKAAFLSWLGAAYFHNQEYAKAKNTFEQAIRFVPDNPIFFGYLASSCNALGQYDEAITAAKRAIELKPDNADAYNSLGQAYMEKKQYAEAYNALKKAIEMAPDNGILRRNMGGLLLKRDDYAGATESFKKAAELDPKNPENFFVLAKTYRLMGRYDDALSAVNKAIELQTITGIGAVIAIEDNYPVVKKIIEGGPAQRSDIQVGDRIVKVDGKSTEGLKREQVVQNLRGEPGTKVALTLERKGIADPFERLVTRETIIGKAHAPTFGLRSIIYRYKGSKEEALKDAEKAYSLDSANEWARSSLGAAYLDLGKHDESIKLLSQVKDSAAARLLEAMAYARQGNMKKATSLYLSIAEEEMSPNNIPMTENRKDLLKEFKPFVKELRDKAKSFEAQGRYKEALAELSEALKMADETEAAGIQETIFGMVRKNPLLSQMPEESRKYSLRGEVLIKEGNFEQAATEFKKAIQIAPYVARLYYNSALINAELKKYPAAIRDMKIYLKAAPDAPDARAAKDEIIKWEFLMEKGKK